MTPLPWIFEPCSPEDVTDPAGQPWQHAVRGRKPAGRVVTGYGHTPPAADADARTKATQYAAREVIGERGEVKAPQFQIESPAGAPLEIVSGAPRDTTINGLGTVQASQIPRVTSPDAPAFFRYYGASETMLLDAGWRVEDGVWIAPQSLIEQAMKEVCE
jgi:hypothetical protein